MQTKKHMPVIKQKQIRHYALDRCFRNRVRRYYIEDLHNECNKDLQKNDCTPVSLRTIKYDLNEIESLYHTDIEHIKDENGRVYYRYADPDFSIQKAMLSDDELEKLKDTILMLSRFKGLPQFEWMTELLTHIETKMHLNNHTEAVISFESNEYLKGLEFMEPLFGYILNQQAINMHYKPFDKPEQHFTLHPYFIKQHNGRWFLFAKDNTSDKILNIALDRILDIKPATVKYIPTDIDFNEHFEDVVGVTIPQDSEPEHILLRFSPSRLPYVISKPLHSSQTEHKDTGLIEITVIPNRELEALLLWFGPDVEVLSPISLRREIAGKIEKMHDLYR